MTEGLLALGDKHKHEQQQQQQLGVRCHSLQLLTSTCLRGGRRAAFFVGQRERETPVYIHKIWSGSVIWSGVYCLPFHPLLLVALMVRHLFVNSHFLADRENRNGFVCLVKILEVQ